ncbi:hypothetical protein V501_04392 [Pseudogymnoascus sp. VKM F-4519 (FW-2642)]|uniref:SGNH hydrolase-type esterase domain-containing protein n=1 Tax=Pseudogymnoascus verrucosus TaxID=342668 RepID=A0A1B8GFC5_9PEZI|nr:uncharacterized protein VE01_07273 [Pseudogymnoascus verrucosus]KFY78531.1 hypothetical protein V499_02334 [Pseudogymnoascus sp. VKM F-103]KFZ12070.1 hypothetical protein V501_04392 [Pseudogymnoascus sp. VKM F-4519 (FW-2642)]OBT94535.1 hypothetical protein VE01_07273 [Pseudogymnoascus verrucosus]
MKIFAPFLVAALATQSWAVPTLYLAGDSTMASGGGGSGTQGFGEYLKNSFSGITIVNKAIGGRSARSYWNEGRFQAIADLVKAGDYVLIEFGHNDGGSLSTTDNGRTDCFGGGSEVCISPTTGEKVYTYVFYLLQAGKLMTAKGAHVVIASPTPNNLWETGTWSYTAPRFTGYGRSVVTSLGSLAAFVDHGLYVANEYKALGATKVNAFYPVDHTHTSPAGAESVAGQFVKGLKCGGSALSAYVTASISGSCY